MNARRLIYLGVLADPRDQLCTRATTAEPPPRPRVELPLGTTARRHCNLAFGSWQHVASALTAHIIRQGDNSGRHVDPLHAHQRAYPARGAPDGERQRAPLWGRSSTTGREVGSWLAAGFPGCNRPSVHKEAGVACLLCSVLLAVLGNSFATRWRPLEST
jgi:hypothetical protein